MQIDFDDIFRVCIHRYETDTDIDYCGHDSSVSESKLCSEENCPLKSEDDILTCYCGKKASFHFCSDCLRLEHEYGKQPF